MRLDLKYRVSIGVLKIIALLPFWVLYRISDLVFLVIFYLVRYRRRVVRTNLDLAFGKSRTKGEIDAIERKFYRHLCDLFVESIKLLHISDREMLRRFVVTNGEVINETSSEGSSQLIMLGHYCNWEWVQAISLYMNLNDNIVAGQIYKPLHDELMDRIMQKIRSRFNLANIPQNRAIRNLLEIQKMGKLFIIGLICDQRPSGYKFHHWGKLFGIDTPLTLGGEGIGLKANAHFLYGAIDKPKRGYYTLTYEKLPPPQEGTEMEEGYYTKLFMSKLEESIEKAPQFWLWSHKIWKRGIDSKMTGYYK